MRFARVFSSLVAAVLISSPVFAQEAVEAAYRAALADSPTPSLVKRAQNDWRAQWNEVEERAEMETLRVEELQRQGARDQAIRADRLPVSDLSTRCVATRLQGCQIEQSGSFTLADGTTLYFQQQAGSTEDDGMSTAMVVLSPEGARLKPVFWLAGPLGVLPLDTWRSDEDGAGDGPTYVALPAYGQGTGHHWEGAMFRWNGRDAAPTEIDVHTWLDRLDEALPEGLGVWKGPQFHWGWLSAESPLWQDSDANCCATGGKVFVELKIEGDALVAANVSVEDAILSVAGNVEPEVLSWVSRRAHCAHWMGEEPYDNARRAEITAAVARLKCGTLDADEATLRRIYADQDATLALLNRAKAADAGS